jgi:hypothetical protein
VDESCFRKRLTQTITWCSLQTLEGDPSETDEFRRRKELARQGWELYKRAQLLEKRGRVRSWLIGHVRLGTREDPERTRQQALELMRAGETASILPLNSQLRTLELKPRAFTWPQTNRAEIVEELAEKRASLLLEKSAYPIIGSLDLAGGKLLACEPDDNMADGASQHQSKGYFDGDDAPPWDTWVCYFDRHLISWVPPLLLGLVQKGIAVNMVDCVHWAEDSLLKELVTPAF